MTVVDISWDFKEIINVHGMNSLLRRASQVVGDREILNTGEWMRYETNARTTWPTSTVLGLIIIPPNREASGQSSCAEATPAMRRAVARLMNFIALTRVDM